MSQATFASEQAELISSRLKRISDYRSRAQSDSTTAGFNSHLADLAQKSLDRIRPALDYLADTGIGATLRRRDLSHYAIFLPDASVPGSFRYQLFDLNGFFSHATHPTLFAAALEACELGYLVPAPGEAERIFSLPSFECGNRIASVLMQHNQGSLSWQDVHQRCAEIKAEYESPNAIQAH